MFETQTFTVVAYRDAAKTDLVEVIPIEDLGMIRSGNREPSGDDTLIRLAQELLKASGHQDFDSFFYTVTPSRTGGR